VTYYTLNGNINVHAYYRHTKAYQKTKMGVIKQGINAKYVIRWDKKQPVQHLNPKPEKIEIVFISQD